MAASTYSSPAYANAAGTLIDVTNANGVRTTISPSDPSAAVWQAAVSGQYGPVAAFAAPVPTQAQLIAFANNKVTALLGAMRTYSADGGTIKSDASSGTIANLMALQIWGTANPDATENWVANDGTIQVVTGAQIAAIATLVGSYAQMIYGTELADVLGKIASGQISTVAQIIAYPWTT